MAICPVGGQAPAARTFVSAALMRGLGFQLDRLGLLPTDQPLIRPTIRPNIGGDLAMARTTKQATKNLNRDQALLESQANYHAIMNSAQESIFLLDLRGVVVEANKIGAERLEMTVKDLIGKSIYNFMPPKVASTRRAALAELLKAGGTTSYEDQRAGKWFESVVSLVIDDSGDNTGYTVITRDITQRKSTEEAFRDSEQLFRRIFEDGPLGMVLTTPDRQILAANDSYCRMLGYTEDELKGYPTTDVTHPDDIENSFERTRKILGGEVSTGKLEKRYLKKTGEIVWANTTVSVILGDDGAPRYCVGMAEDITQRKRAEEALRDSEQRFRRIFEDGPLGMVLTTPDRQIIAANESYCRMLGYTEDELKGCSTMDVTHPDDQAIGFERARKVASGETISGHLEKRFIMKTGETVWGSTTVSTIRDDEGTHRYSVGMVENITARKQAIDALAQSEARFRAVIDHSPHGIQLKDTEGRLSVVSRTYKKWFGDAEGGWIGKTLDDIFPKDLADMIAALDKETLSTNTMLRKDIELPFVDHSLHKLELTKFPVRGADEQVLGVGTITVDVTEQVRAQEAHARSEARFRAIVDNSPDAILLKDPEGRYLLVNRKYKEWFGDSGGNWTGKSVYDIFPKDVADEMTNLDKKVLSTNMTIQRELDIPFFDGKVHKLMTTKFVVRDTEDQVLGVGMIADDVTEKRRTERQFQQSSKMATLGQMAAGLVHDLAQPLNVIRMAADNVIIDSEDGTVGQSFPLEQCKKISDQTIRMSKIIDQIRVFSRDDPIAQKPFDPNQSIRASIDIVEDIFQLDNVSISADLKHEGIRVLGDSTRLEQVLVGIMMNARDAIVEKAKEQGTTADKPPGYVRISSKLRKNQKSVVFSIADSGGGIADDVVDHIFDPFFTTKDPGLGTGLGLSIAFRIVEQMGGQISALNAYDGAVLAIELPVSG